MLMIAELIELTPSLRFPSIPLHTPDNIDLLGGAFIGEYCRLPEDDAPPKDGPLIDTWSGRLTGLSRHLSASAAS